MGSWPQAGENFIKPMHGPHAPNQNYIQKLHTMHVLMGLLLCYELNIFLLMTKQSSLSLSDTSDTTLTVHACFVVGMLVDEAACTAVPSPNEKKVLLTVQYSTAHNLL